jgi:hypothetical protein
LKKTIIKLILHYNATETSLQQMVNSLYSSIKEQKRTDPNNKEFFVTVQKRTEIAVISNYLYIGFDNSVKWHDIEININLDFCVNITMIKFA